MSRIYVVGIGPGSISAMTEDAKSAIENSDVIVGYKVYTDLIKELCEGKEIVDSGMRQEIERCKLCAELALSGKTVSLICSGDAGVYAMASPMLQVALDAGFSDVIVVPGVTSALSGAAV
ncbi:MAG: precorrin-3B C(17)-methyltransferase, partial [Lachnospiraceae bacterium]|nr:precorrin-3B C(17)-methyltransferase [Lachnospiraceae bacterium]